MRILWNYIVRGGRVMAKRNIRGKSGKQLYINKIFGRGMLYTSSEMPDGFTKLISNYDIAPTGDSAIPRKPYSTLDHSIQVIDHKYVYPVKFTQAINKQHFIAFNNTVTEEDFANDTLPEINKISEDTIKMFHKHNNKYEIEGITTSPSYDPDFPPSVEFANVSKDSLAVNGVAFHRIELYLLERTNKFVIYYGRRVTMVDIPIISAQDIYVHDADTIRYDNTDYRLVSIDAPEKDQKWHEHGKRYLRNLIDSVPMNSQEGTFSLSIRPLVNKETGMFSRDVHGRVIAYFYIKHTSNTLSTCPYCNGTGFLDTPIGQPCLICNPSAHDPNAGSWYEENYLYIQEILVREGLAKLDYAFGNYDHTEDLIVSQTDAKTDGLKMWGPSNIDPLYNSISNLVVYPDDLNPSCIQAVRIVGSKPVYYKTQNIVDDVKFIYIDYLDAVGFIGRIIKLVDNTPVIKYKGLILIKCDINENDEPYFKVTLPPNNYQGTIPDLAEASSNGYNLYNDDLINTDDTDDSSSPTYIKGIAVTPPSGEGTIIQQAIIGQPVVLRAIQNETYFPFSFIPDITYSGTVNISEDYNPAVDTIPISSVYYADLSSTAHQCTTKNVSILSFYCTITGINLRYNKNTVALTEPIEFNISGSGHHDKVGEVIKTITIDGNKFDITLTSLVDSPNHQYIYSATFVISASIPNLDSEHEKALYAKWEVAPYGSNEFVPIRDYFKLFTVDNATNSVTKVANEDTEFTPTQQGNLIVKYTLTPAYVVGSLVIMNELASLSATIPALKVGHEYVTIDNSDLKRNLNIRDATRIGIFNKQIYMYGKYTKTNTVFFSSFEDPWFYNFPYSAINMDESIVYGYTYNEQLVLFGKENIYMLSTEGSINEATRSKIYENLSITDSDINSVSSMGTNLIFFSSGVGFITSTNKFYDDPTNITVYKLTDNINDALTNPEPIIRLLEGIPISSFIQSINIESKVFIENNFINIICNYSYVINNAEYNAIIIFKYNQSFKQWSTYYLPSTLVSKITSTFKFEPFLGVQMAVLDSDGYFNVLYTNDKINEFLDKGVGGSVAIEGVIDSGFLSVDTMNSKRFKDLMFDFNDIMGRTSLDISCMFFVDGAPVLIGSDASSIIVDEYGSETELSPSGYNEGDIVFVHVNDVSDNQNFYGTKINVKGEDFTVSGRCNLRVPVGGKGRLPSFVLKIKANNLYKLMSYSLIYKEKDISRRS